MQDAHGIPDLQNAVVDACIDQNVDYKKTPTGKTSNVYEHTTERSPLRKLFVDWTVAHSVEECFTGPKGKRMCQSFLLDLAVAQCKVNSGIEEIVKDFKAHRSNYHVPAST